MKLFENGQALLFDMDGVLFSSTNCHARAYTETFQAIGINDFSYPLYAGVRTDEAVRQVLREHSYPVDEAEVTSLVEEKQRLVRQYLAEEGCVIDGARKLLTEASKHYRLALATSASAGTVDIFFEKLGLPRTLFQVVINGSQVSHAKPAPDIYLLAAEQLGVAPSECVVIEDSVSGVIAGKAANMRVIGIEGTDRAESLKESGADICVASLAEITKRMGS